MRLTKIFLCLMAVSLFSFTTLKTNNSNTAGWRFLGDKSVGFGVDHDVLHFGNWSDDVRRIKLRITDGPLKMYSMTIHFDNGSTQSVSLRFRFAQESESKIIELDGGLRHLDKIEFSYETKGFARGKSRVAVWGTDDPMADN
ncbi:MAG: hypothetical protein H7Y01_06630 [Ferruginibacter sp.]|nr:hypothetical protein [Chitinophagaceae bacterium]